MTMPYIPSIPTFPRPPWEPLPDWPPFNVPPWEPYPGIEINPKPRIDPKPPWGSHPWIDPWSRGIMYDQYTSKKGYNNKKN